MSSTTASSSSVVNPLSASTIKHYRSIGHALKPVVIIAGNSFNEESLSESVLQEINRALSDHELIKIKLALGDRLLRQTAISMVCASSQAVLVQEIGKTALIFRKTKKANPKLSNLLRKH